MRTRLLASALLLAAVATILVAAPGSTQSSYIYKRGDTTYMRGSIEDLETALAGREGEFVWTRLGGREYVITDPTVLAVVRAAFADLDAKQKPLRDIEKRLEPHERELERVEERVDDLGDRLGDEELPESTRAELERQLAAAEAEMRAIEKRMHGVEQELEHVEREMERIEEAVEAEFERIVERAVREGKAKRVD